MSSSIVNSVHMILFITSTFLLFSIPNVIATTSSSSLIQEACKGRKDVDFCLQILQSEQKIASATNLFDLSIALMELGLSNATNTLSHIESKLKETNLEPNLKHALQVCNSSYIWAVGSLDSALSEVRDIKEYQIASYDLSMASSDAIDPCQTALDSIEIKDEIISSGNKFLKIFGYSAIDIVDVLYGQSINS